MKNNKLKENSHQPQLDEKKSLSHEWLNSTKDLFYSNGAMNKNIIS